MRRAIPLIALAAVLLAAGSAAAAPRLVELGRFTRPVHVASPPDDARLFVVEQGGTVRILDPSGAIAPQPFLDVTAETSTSANERGLLSIAFPPDYSASGFFYVFLTAAAPAGQLQVREYRRSASDPGRADPAPTRTLLAVDHPRGNHNGGGMAFGPDGKLWITTGDGGASNDPDANGQDRGTLLGKLLRLDPRGASLVPSDNPFAAPTDGARDEIWAYGLRNPWRFSFDRQTGDLLIGDVGQDRTEEIDFAAASAARRPGANYGWRCFEGSQPTPGVTPCSVPDHALPIHELDHVTAGVCSITGGYVVRDPGLPTLSGRYLYADVCLDRLRSFALVDGRAAGDRAEADLAAAQVASFGQDACGRILVVQLAGPVSRIADGDPTPCAPAPAPAPGPVVGGPPPGPAANPCALRTAIPRTRGSAAVRRSGLGVGVRVLAGCTVSATARIRGVATLRARPRSVVAGQRVTLRLKLSSAGRRALRRRLARHRSAIATVTVTATSGATPAQVRSGRTRIRR